MTSEGRTANERAEFARDRIRRLMLLVDELSPAQIEGYVDEFIADLKKAFEVHEQNKG